MATIEVDGSDLVLHLSAGEHALVVRGNPRAPISSLRGAEVLEDAHEPADHGFRVGERIPGVSEVLTIHDQGEKIFAAVHHSTPRGVRLRFEGADWDAWIVGCEDPESVIAALPRTT